MNTSLLRNARLTDGRVVDVRVADGLVASVDAAGSATADADVVHDLDGLLLLPAPAEPHAHLDKAYTADRVPNPTGDLLGAILAWRSSYGMLTVEDIAARAERAALASLANGLTAIRTHVDLGPDIGLRAIEALVGVRDRLADLVNIQIVALTAPPVTGLAGADQRARLRDALDLGADAIGGAPYLDPEPRAAHAELIELAMARGKPIDLHTDETLEADVLTLVDYAEIITSSGGSIGAAASHCVSLGVQPAKAQAAVADAVARAGVSVITLPQTNLFLQSRGVPTAAARGLTAISALRAAGVNVAGGADNLQDPFNTVGRADPMETAALLVMAGHLDPMVAYELVTSAARIAMGLPPVSIAAGAPAELIAVDALNTREAIASAPGTRIVFHNGRLVARTTHTVEIAGLHASDVR
jgi:cytosine deaminase